MKIVKVFSLVIIFICVFYFIFRDVYSYYDISIQNRIIDNAFSIDNSSDDYLGYIYIPKYNIKRIIKYGTTSDILDSGYVGMYGSYSDLASDSLIVLAGHDIVNVFSCLHKISIGDYIFLKSNSINRKFVIYDKKVIKDDDFSYFYNRPHELMLITCDKEGYRLLVFLKEVL